MLVRFASGVSFGVGCVMRVGWFCALVGGCWLLDVGCWLLRMCRLFGDRWLVFGGCRLLCDVCCVLVVVVMCLLIGVNRRLVC